ncbi:type II toxin-antitoxin system VapC family toxin [Nitrosophilus kaiyonis]|uniref:type II toxin-antitoxin system VapC family toxin n=1 Tax=Nitrosophilus kaiyonis TaxID=2930200 RepID=UPI0024919A26|nr:PIN domain-containing protein [Nitrosophilus kaiyonis]
MRIFIDANIILDIFSKDRKNHIYSKEIIKYLLEKEYELYISSDMITNIFYILKNRYKLEFENVLNIIENLLKIYKIVYIDKADLDIVIILCKNKKFLDFEDALQYVCAKKEDCKFIITNNKKDFKNSDIKTLSSLELFKKIDNF